MKTFKTILYAMLIACLLLSAACKKDKPEIVQPVPEVKILAADLQANLAKIDDALAELISKQANKFGTETDIRVLLTAGAQIHPAVITACYIDKKGVLKYLEPAKYKEAEGADISSQAHIAEMIKNPAPNFSEAFKAVEGYATVVIARPLFDAKEKFVGSIALTLNTELLANMILGDNNVSSEYELWAMQPDGMMVCNQDQGEIGLNLFTDPLYDEFQSLRILGKKIAAEPTGEGEYSFWATGTQTETNKTATWDTISLHGREWRVVLVHRAQ